MKRIGLLLLLLVAFASPRGGLPDMNTATCQDWLDAGEDEQEQMVAWLRGFVAGRSTGAIFDLSRVRADAVGLKRFCQSHMASALSAPRGLGAIKPGALLCVACLTAPREPRTLSRETAPRAAARHCRCRGQRPSRGDIASADLPPPIVRRQ